MVSWRSRSKRRRGGGVLLEQVLWQDLLSTGKYFHCFQRLGSTMEMSSLRSKCPQWVAMRLGTLGG